MRYAISRKIGNINREYYCGDTETYTNDWTDSKTLAVTFNGDRAASLLMHDMENGYIYQLVEIDRPW